MTATQTTPCTHVAGLRTALSAHAPGGSAGRAASFPARLWPFQGADVTRPPAVPGADTGFPTSSSRGTAERPCPICEQRRRNTTSLFPTKLAYLS